MVLYTRAQGRCFSRCLLGLQKFRKLDVRVRFLTLTLPACNCVREPVQGSLDGDVRSPKDRDGMKCLIQSLWRVLYLRMVREFGKIPYFSVRTSESNGVLHVVLACGYIPFDWIMEQWVEIAGTCYIWICDPYVRRYGLKDRTEVECAHYLMCQYVGLNQPDFVYGCSGDWVYRGFSKDFSRLRSVCRDSSQPPIFEAYGMVVFPIDKAWFWRSWEALMEEKVYRPRQSFDVFMRRVKEVSCSEFGFERVL